MKRTRAPKSDRMAALLHHPEVLRREINKKSFYEFFQYFWDEVSSDELKLNWHIQYLCDELQDMTEKVAQDINPGYSFLIINIPPGTTKSTIVSRMFPVWAWTKYHNLKFITSSYSAALSLELAEASRDLLRSEYFKTLYPELEIKQDKDTKSNFRIVKKHEHMKSRAPRLEYGGSRYSTSVGGTVTGFHGHILLVDDPLDPLRSYSEKELNTANRWISETLSTRKTNKDVSPVVLIMQRLHQNDCTGHILRNIPEEEVKHISLPAELENYGEQVKPKELRMRYQNGLLDPVRLSSKVLNKMKAQLGQYGYAGQMGQKPTPPGGGMFQVDQFQIIDRMSSRVNFIKTVRYWDKAGSKDSGAYTVGVKIAHLQSGKLLVLDVVRGQWASNEREHKIKQTAEADGREVEVYYEQEPGSGGKESAEATTKNLMGFTARADRPQGDKIYRADPYSVQVNDGNVMLMYGAWNNEFVEEHRFFPYGTYKDQVDAASGGFSKLVGRKQAKVY